MDSNTVCTVVIIVSFSSVVTETITSTTRLTSLPPSESLWSSHVCLNCCQQTKNKKRNKSNYSSKGSSRWVTASCVLLCVFVARGNQRIKSQEYVQQCWRAGLGEECLNPEQQQWNLLFFMWEQLSTLNEEAAVLFWDAECHIFNPNYKRQILVFCIQAGIFYFLKVALTSLLMH